MQLFGSRLSYVGGQLALDFSNTVGDHARSDATEKLHSLTDLLAWAEQAGVIQAESAGELARRVASHPAEAQRIVKEAITLRGTLYRIFSALSHGRTVPPGDLNLLNAFLVQFPVTLQVIPESKRFLCVRQSSLLDEARLLGPIAWSAVELLSSDQLAKVRECAGNDCSWLFLDLTKNQSRCWCSMSDCGSRAKARRHYQRKTERA
ncbi:MAG TPA: ABATE domain-containing protein [Chthoniobacterales bacterium]